MNNTIIDITKKYKTRDGRAVTGLLAHSITPSIAFYPFVGEVAGRGLEYWTHSGRFHTSGMTHPLDLVLAEDQPVPGLLTPDPLRVEYGTFVAAVKANFAAGTFATATQEQFDAWLESLTPILAR